MKVNIGIKAREVIFFTQKYPCAETRNYLLNKLIDKDLLFAEFAEIRKNKCYGDNAAIYESELEAIATRKPYYKIIGFDIVKKGEL